MNPEPNSLTCPKCQGSMRAYERGGVTIDQCGDCRGVFLDRGELDRLIDSESAFYQGRTTVPAAAPDSRRVDSRHFDDRHYDDDRGYRDQGYGDRAYGHSSYRKRKKSFLSELFD